MTRSFDYDPFANLQSPTAPLRPIPEAYWVIPGRLLAGEYPIVSYNPEVTDKRLGAFLESGFEVMINLTCLGEGQEYTPRLLELAAARGLQVNCLRFPIGDYGLPAPAEMNAILDAIDRAMQEKRRAYLHCYGGIGRTGTVVGCYLVRHGLSGEQAVRQLAEWWRNVPKSRRFPNSPETLEQEDMIRHWKAQAG